MNSAFWRGRRVLITGHTGFKGGWLSLWLQSMGADVIGYALSAPTNPSLFETAKVSSEMTSVIGDIRDIEYLQSVFSKYNPEVVFHLAAQPLVRYSYLAPIETYSTNVMGTVNLLESVRNTPSVKAVVNVTSDKCYANQEWIWGYRETEPMGGEDPYSNSKGCAELVSSSYRSSFFNANSYPEHGVALATARAGNVIGGGDWSKDRLIPDILAAFETKTPVNIRNPNAIRPWQHVLEPLHGYITLAERLYQHGPTHAEGWNFGPNDEDTKTVAWVVEAMADIWDEDSKWQVDYGIHPHEATYLKLDISKARSRLNWRPVLRINEALQLTIDWSKQYRSNADMRVYTLGQIQAYQKLIES